MGDAVGLQAALLGNAVLILSAALLAAATRTRRANRQNHAELNARDSTDPLDKAIACALEGTSASSLSSRQR